VTDSLRTMHAAGYARQLDHDRLMARIRREEWPLGFMAYEAGIHTLHNGLAYYLDPAGKIDVTGSAQRRHGPPPPRLNSALLEDILRCSVRALAGRNVGLLLSGGLDSALVAALLAAENVPFRAACVSNSRNQRDVENALAVCSELGIDLAVAEPTLDDYLMALPIAASVFEDARPDVYQALGLIFGARALGGSCDLLMGGEPADDVLRSSREFFEARSPAHREYLWAECLRDTIPRSIYLTKCAASHIGAGSSSPYSDDALIAAASNTPWDELQDPGPLAETQVTPWRGF
jgi:asparagine synthetase B (glutamine-hydrolysing)